MGFLEICNSDKLVRYGSKQNGCGCDCVSCKDPNFIYTDGSLYNKTGQGGYGIYSSGLNINLANQYPYGQHKNLVATIELKGILEAIRHIKLRHHSRPRIDIFTDCEFALVHLVNMVDGKEGPELYNNLGAAILKEIKEDQKWLAKVVLHKVKAHSGIKGNQVADQYAKLGAKKAPKLHLLPHSTLSPVNSLHCNREQNNEFYSTSSPSFDSCSRKTSRLSCTPTSSLSVR